MLLEQEVLRHHRSHATGATELRGHDGEVKQSKQDVPHVRVSVNQTLGAEQRCRILDVKSWIRRKNSQFETHRFPAFTSLI